MSLGLHGAPPWVRASDLGAPSHLQASSFRAHTVPHGRGFPSHGRKPSQGGRAAPQAPSAHVTPSSRSRLLMKTQTHDPTPRFAATAPVSHLPPTVPIWTRTCTRKMSQFGVLKTGSPAGKEPSMRRAWGSRLHLRCSHAWDSGSRTEAKSSPGLGVQLDVQAMGLAG